ncbi:MAG TPA: DUF4190 domain-containing protein [Pyrinomonadaceae bacterium]|nr:DUF4190 domain-containing protein [Pyrinomonadaceae bacterium]
MKRCPTCQKDFPDSMRFCQTDGTPLLDPTPAAETPEDPYKTVVGQPTPAEDPFKTVVGGFGDTSGGGAEQSKDNDILQLPDEPDDLMKTMVVPPEDWNKAGSSPSTASSPQAGGETPVPEPPKFSEPDLNPPAFGDLSPQPQSSTGDIFGSGGGGSGSSSSGAPPFSSPGEPNISDSPFGQPPMNSPFQSPFEQQKPSFEPPPPPSPFESPTPVPQAYKEPESPFGGSSGQTPFDQSPFAPPPPAPSAAQMGSDLFASQQPQAEWNPPPAPMQNWQNQQLGENTPFQPPGAGGQNQTLAIVSLVTGILSLICCGSYLFSIVAVVTGFMAKGKAESDSSNFGGRGMAIAGLIMGVFGLIASVLVTILWFLGAFGGRF